MIDDETKGTVASCLMLAIHEVLYKEAREVWQKVESEKFSELQNLDALQHLGSLCFSVAKTLTADADHDLKIKEKYMLERNEI